MKTSRISGTLAMAAKQWEMMGWPERQFGQLDSFVHRFHDSAHQRLQTTASFSQQYSRYAMEDRCSMLTFGRSRDNGRNLVPRDGPPTFDHGQRLPNMPSMGRFSLISRPWWSASCRISHALAPASLPSLQCPDSNRIYQSDHKRVKPG